MNQRTKIVLEYVERFGHPFLPLPEAPRNTETYNEQWEKRRELSTRRLDEMADRLCLPVPYLTAILVNLEDRGVIDWRTGKIKPPWSDE